jgi:hypothetical protein
MLRGISSYLFDLLKFAKLFYPSSGGRGISMTDIRLGSDLNIFTIAGF